MVISFIRFITEPDLPAGIRARVAAGLSCVQRKSTCKDKDVPTAPPCSSGRARTRVRLADLPLLLLQLAGW